MRDSAPLCPAGHLPPKGGDWPSPPPSRTATVAEASGAPNLPISPQVGEMSGRTEGARRITTDQHLS
ncbi:MAG: hypothetical protein EOQ86_19300 [Mesorhizobium sp.]|nr:MAG: hypothetical protein EOQ85_17775 [Mesorhizobium sp.]RWH80789.1 MAG: hypothetical protein EOQ86_19300 [Mesorhizobium sp.]RWH89039.1 MAG: hypothetical protein EOQ87_19740 [Mesorhizobium sp.]RWH97062.1 MAG: hypothetical protein EOQ88_18750 [Mesorhizobium sp.]RWI00191.1 MAG: hypothetical protein EOQ89_20640 [Mesorhizobium sp.]